MAERRDGALARTLGRRWSPVHTTLPARLFDLPPQYALIAAGGALLLFATHESAGRFAPARKSPTRCSHSCPQPPACSASFSLPYRPASRRWPGTSTPTCRLVRHC